MDVDDDALYAPQVCAWLMRACTVIAKESGGGRGIRVGVLVVL